MGCAVNMPRLSIVFPSFLFYSLFFRNLASSYHQPLWSNWGKRTLLGHTGEDGKGAGEGGRDVVILHLTFTDCHSGSWGL